VNYNHTWLKKEPTASEVTRQIEKWVQAGICKPCSSQDIKFTSSLLLVKKQRQSKTDKQEYRLCLNFKPLNSITMPDPHRVSLMTEELHKFAGKTCINTIDIRHGFNNIPMSEQTKSYSGFYWQGNYFKLEVMHFGFTTAPQGMQRAMDYTLKNESNATCYVDDISILCTSIEEGLDNADSVLTKLERDGWKIRLDKCYWLQTQVVHLGCIVNDKGVLQKVDHINAICNFPVPQNKKDVQILVGLITWMSPFISNLHIYKTKFSYFKRKNVDFKKSWTEAHTSLFKEFQQHMFTNRTQLLFHPIPELRYGIDVDSSKEGWGTVVYQIGRKRIYPVEYIHGTWTDQERTCHNTILETKAVVKSLERLYAHYLHSEKVFFLFTDCTTVLGALNKATPDKNSKYARWIDLINNHKMILLHKKEMLNGMADYFSRIKGRYDLDEYSLKTLKDEFLVRHMVNNIIPQEFQDEFTTLNENIDQRRGDSLHTIDRTEAFFNYDQLHYPSDIEDHERVDTDEDLRNVLKMMKVDDNVRHINVPSQNSPSKETIHIHSVIKRDHTCYTIPTHNTTQTKSRYNFRTRKDYDYNDENQYQRLLQPTRKERICEVLLS